MQPPQEPRESDCCNSGCNPCILDVYETQLKKYREWLKKSGSEGAQTEISAIAPTVYAVFELTERKQVAEAVFLLKFKYADSKEQPPNALSYESGQYFLLRARDCEGEFTRAYTPIPVNGNEGLTFTILVRLYEGGRMSKVLKKLKLGHKTSWRGPYGDFRIDYSRKYLLFIAQGTGIAPVFAVINEIVGNEECECFVKLFFCCRNSDDILLREELYKMGSFWNFTYEVFLSDNANLIKKYNEIVHETKLNSTNIANYVNDKVEQLQAIICGSENFSENIKTVLENSGINSKHIYVF